MSKVSVAAFVSTNLDRRSINDGFTNAVSVLLAKTLHTTVENVTVEFQCGVEMMRGASSAPMLNIRLFHNSDTIDKYNKAEKAEALAAWLARQIRVPIDRVLVLFLDTRLCATGQQR